MGQVIANARMSLDGYIAKNDNTMGRLPTASPGLTFHVGAASTHHLVFPVTGAQAAGER